MNMSFSKQRYYHQAGTIWKLPNQTSWGKRGPRPFKHTRDTNSLTACSDRSQPQKRVPRCFPFVLRRCLSYQQTMCSWILCVSIFLLSDKPPSSSRYETHKPRRWGCGNRSRTCFRSHPRLRSLGLSSRQRLAHKAPCPCESCPRWQRLGY